MSISVDFSLRRKKSMKRFNIFDPLASDSNQSKDDDNDGDPHRLVVMDGAKVDNALVPCDYCERTFSADRIKKHVEERIGNSAC